MGLNRLDIALFSVYLLVLTRVVLTDVQLQGTHLGHGCGVCKFGSRVRIRW